MVLMFFVISKIVAFESNSMLLPCL